MVEADKTKMLLPRMYLDMSRMNPNVLRETAPLMEALAFHYKQASLFYCLLLGK